MSQEILKDIIDDFQTEKFINFFCEKNRKLCSPNTPLNYEDANNSFKEGRKIAGGRLDDGELGVYSFLVNKNLSERSGKKAQYELGKKILKQSQADAGIFIFYDPQGNFRFSLIYANYLGRKRDWSNFRRFTYFVSKELTNKTFLQRIGEGDLSNLEKIKEAFSVEKVTKEFYQEIANWYFWAVQESKFPEDAEKEENGRNIAVIRLITRMIFIWFMKVRNLIPDELFNINKIKEILKDVSPNESTYYKAILQNLFFATLNARQKERKFRSEIRGYKGFNPDFGNHNVYRHHALFKTPERMQEYFGNIPFLNGGLFDCLDYKSKKKEERFYIDGFTDTKQYQPYVPNFLFFEEEKSIDLNEEYGTKGKRYKVRGLINILSSYNFTIDENEPDDLEVALDPELLGRVFENLLASYNPETATTARKATGSYNTPREIVDYMVTQSLINYFKTHLNNVSDIDTKLSELFSKENHNNPFDNTTTKRLISLIESLRIVDPAVGSGAFPMGILNKLVFILSKIDPDNKLWKQAQIEAINRDVKDVVLKEKLITQAEEYFKTKNTDYLRKLYLIEKCIYGVDIQQIAVEIAKLRFFISLLVDEEIDKHKENWGIEPLPNLDFKLMQGNSLIFSFAGIDFGRIEGQKDKKQLFLEFTTRYDELIKQFEDTKNQYQNEPDKDKKDKLREKIEELIWQIFEEKLKEHLSELKKIEESASQIPNPKQRQDYITAEKQKLAKKYGFDLEEAQKELIAYTEGRKPKNFFLWDVYFAEVFTGDNPGFDIVIGNPPYIQLQKAFNNKLKYADLYKCQNYQTFERTGDIYCLFYEKGLELLQGKGHLCYITSNKWMRAGYGEALRSFFTKYNPKLLIDLGPNVFESATVDTSILLIQKANNENKLKAVTINENKKEGIDISKIVKEKSVQLRNIGKDAWFIGSIAEQRLKEKIEKIGKPLKEWDVKIYRGVLTGLNEAFIISTEKRNEILANCKTKDERKRTEAIIKPILRGRDIKRYYHEWAGLWVIVIPAGWTSENRGNNNAEKFILEQFPSLMGHLKEYEAKAKKRDDQGDYWWELRHCAYYPEFEKEKVVYSEIVREPQFYFDKENFYVEATSFLMTGKSVKYICGLLNSKPVTFFFKEWYAGGGLGDKGYRYKKAFLENLPIPPITPANEPIVRQIELLVDRILAAKKENKNADTSDYERQIDQMVYKLYGLTEEEISVVKSNFKEK